MTLLNPYQRARLLLLTACLLCCALAWWISRLFGVPASPGFEAALLQQPSVAMAIVAAAAAALIGTAVGTLIAGPIRFNAGVFAAAMGLGAFSIRGGAMPQTIHWGLSHGSAAGLFTLLLVETLILGLILAVCFVAVLLLWSRGVLRDRQWDEPLEAPEIRANVWPAMAVQILAGGIGMLLLAPVADKGQVLAAVFLSSYGGAVLAQYLFPAPRHAWLWAAPILLGAIGYAVAIFSHDGVEIGILRGTFAALARPLPLDYASAGPVGAIMGHWLARRWQQQAADAVAAGPAQ
jgi:hypothetical protein